MADDRTAKAFADVDLEAMMQQTPGACGDLHAPWKITQDDGDAIIVRDARGQITWMEEWDMLRTKARVEGPEYDAEIAQQKTEVRARVACVVLSINTFATFSRHPLIAGFEFFAKMDAAHVVRTKPGSTYIGHQTVVASCATGEDAYKWAPLLATMLQVFGQRTPPAETQR
jgi:hypothetical protein